MLWGVLGPGSLHVERRTRGLGLGGAVLKAQASAPGGEQITRIAEALFEHSPAKDYGDPTQYEVIRPMRGHLERAICLGLGQFDLVIIDEAHKGRATESKLSVLIDRLWLGENARRVGLTATPVELDSNQWLQSICRIDVREEEHAVLNGKIERYRHSVSARGLVGGRMRGHATPTWKRRMISRPA